MTTHVKMNIKSDNLSFSFLCVFRIQMLFTNIAGKNWWEG